MASNTITIALVKVRVTLTRDDNYADAKFDQMIEERYPAIEREIDVSDTIKRRLTDVGGPLAGLGEVEVTIG